MRTDEPASHTPTGPDAGSRRSGPLEALFQETVRRAASLGLSSFFLTEEALRRAFSDSVPRDWVDYLARQGDEVRAELFEALSRQFREWLQEVDLVELLGELVRRNDLSVRLELSASPRADSSDAAPRSTLEVISRRE